MDPRNWNSDFKKRVNRHFKHKFKDISDFNKTDNDAVNWFCLDLYKEPLSALLLLCDELQEWSRERLDLEQSFIKSGKGDYRTPIPELTHFEVSDAAGLSVNERLLLRVNPSDRQYAYRIRREQERDNAKNSRMLQTRGRQAGSYGRDAGVDWQLEFFHGGEGGSIEQSGVERSRKNDMSEWLVDGNGQ